MGTGTGELGGENGPGGGQTPGPDSREPVPTGFAT